MRKTLITGVLSIGILTLVVINTHADDGSYVLHAGDKVLDLSKPENIERLTGTWEGSWKNLNSAVNGTLTMVIAPDPKNEELPFVIKTKRLGSPRSDPNKWATSRAKLEGSNLVNMGTYGPTTYSLIEEANGELRLHVMFQGRWSGRENAEVVSELHKAGTHKVPSVATR